MNGNLATDPFATNETEFTAVFAGTKTSVESSQPSLAPPARGVDHAADPLATNPLPEQAMEPGNDKE